MWAAIIQAVLGALGGIINANQLYDYADSLEEAKKEIPSALISSDKILSEMSNKGIPEKEAIEAAIMESMPRTLNEARKVVDSPSKLIGALSDTYSKVEQNLLNVRIEDARAKLGNKDKYAQFLSQVKAPMEERIDSYNKSIDSQIKQINSQADWAIVQGILGGTSQGINTYSASQEKDFYQDLSKQLVDYWTTNGQSQSNSNQKSQAYNNFNFNDQSSGGISSDKIIYDSYFKDEFVFDSMLFDLKSY